MSCSKCRDSKDPYHDKCRTHAYCAKDFRYHAAPCSVCQDLWERARDIDAPDGAIVAFRALEDWIGGFRRNSRNRTKGIDYFYEPLERSAYQDLHALHNNLQVSLDLDSSRPNASTPSVSLKFSFSEFENLWIVYIGLLLFHVYQLLFLRELLVITCTYLQLDCRGLSTRPSSQHSSYPAATGQVDRPTQDPSSSSQVRDG